MNDYDIMYSLINKNLTKAVSNFQEVLLMKAEESIVTHDLLRIVSV